MMAVNLPAPPDDAPARPSEVRVLARGLAILRAFEPANEWRTNTELATLAELPKPTVSRLTANLTESGYLIYSAERAAYRLSTSVLALGFIAASNRNLVVIARPLMQEFADQHNLSVVLASPDGGSMVCNEVAHSRALLFTLRVRVGSRLRMGQSAVGRALIGSMGDAERDRVLARLEDADHETWSVLQGQVKTVVSQMQRRGYVTAAGTLERGTNGVAVVIDTPDGPHAFALGCAAPSGILSVSRIESEVAPDLLALKRRLEAELSVTAQGLDN
ncbi:MAG: IclR family transcriptional regulator [Pseudomonadota bacterium]|jgi:DNA-binding IclR family transcriptional regulator